MCSPEPRCPVKRYDPRKTTVPYPGAHTGAPLHMDHTQHPFIPHYIKIRNVTTKSISNACKNGMTNRHLSHAT